MKQQVVLWLIHYLFLWYFTAQHECSPRAPRSPGLSGLAEPRRSTIRWPQVKPWPWWAGKRPESAQLCPRPQLTAWPLLPWCPTDEEFMISITRDNQPHGGRERASVCKMTIQYTLYLTVATCRNTVYIGTFNDTYNTSLHNSASCIVYN